jgi:hypothetical protein
MNKTAIKNFAVWARNKLIADISYKAGLMGISEVGLKQPFPSLPRTWSFMISEPKNLTSSTEKPCVSASVLQS